MKSKVITLTGDKQEEFIKVIASRFGVIAPSELKLIGVLIQYDMFSPFHLDKYTRIKLQQAMDCPMATLSSSLSRLDKANVLVRKGKTRWFNASFRNLNDIDMIVFRVQ